MFALVHVDKDIQVSGYIKKKKRFYRGISADLSLLNRKMCFNKTSNKTA